jgi:hypothetical protein
MITDQIGGVCKCLLIGFADYILGRSEVVAHVEKVDAVISVMRQHMRQSLFLCRREYTHLSATDAPGIPSIDDGLYWALLSGRKPVISTVIGL